MFFKKSKNGVTISVRVEPRSSKSGIVGVVGDRLKVKLTSPPVDGKANEELIGLLSKTFGAKKRDIKIIRGASSKDKLVEITGGAVPPARGYEPPRKGSVPPA